jgi:hypothetical protein
LKSSITFPLFGTGGVPRKQEERAPLTQSFCNVKLYEEIFDDGAHNDDVYTDILGLSKPQSRVSKKVLPGTGAHCLTTYCVKAELPEEHIGPLNISFFK